MEGTRETEKCYLPNILLSMALRKAMRARVEGGVGEILFPAWSQKARKYLPEFHRKGSIDFGAVQIFLVWVCPVYCREKSSLKLVYKNVHTSVHMLQREQRNPQLETITRSPLHFTVKERFKGVQ